VGRLDVSTLQSRFDPRANNFDLVRLIAALVVVYGHSYALAENKYDPLSTFLSYGLCGALAVWSFLVISGFLIARSEEGSGLSAFVAARFLRIYPAFLIIVLVESFIIAPIFYEGPKSEYFQHWLTYHLHNALIWPQDPWSPTSSPDCPIPPSMDRCGRSRWNCRSISAWWSPPRLCWDGAICSC